MNWLVYSLISLASMGLLNIVLKLAAEKVDAFLTAFLIGLFAAMFLFPIVVFRGKLSFSRYGLIGGLLWAFSIVCLNIALSKGEISRVLPIFSLSGVFAAIIGITLLNESITTPKIIGIIFSAIAIILLSI